MNLSKIVIACCLLGPVWSQGQVVISSLSQYYGAYGDPNPVFIYGSGFYPGTVEVRYNGVLDTTAQATSPTVIQSMVPNGATTGWLTVRVNGGNTAYSPEVFIIGPKPHVTRFTPAGGSDTLVSIEGAYLAGASVKFGGVNARNVNNGSFTLITCNPPLGVINGPITVTTSAGSFVTSSNFIAPPIITGFSPAIGRAGTNLIVTGTNFAGASAFWFTGTNGDISAEFTVLSNRAVRVRVPEGAFKGPIRVQSLAGTYPTSSNFVMEPLITAFSPMNGAIGSTVILSGANFTGSSKTNVFFNGVQASLNEPASFARISARVPTGAATGPIRVETADGSYSTLGFFFLPPIITGFSTNTGAPGQSIVLSGNNFLGTTGVKFNDLETTFFPPTNNSTLVVTVPANFTSGPITVTAPGGEVTSSIRFYAAPSILSFQPTSGLPGTVVQIQGVNFLDATSVQFNGKPANFTVVNNSLITAFVPDQATTGPISVIAPGGTNVSSQNFVLDYRSDLRVIASGSPTNLTVGETLTYNFSFHNDGPHAAQNVVFSNTFPPGVVFKENGQPATTWVTNLASFASGASVYFQWEVIPQTHGTLTNLAEVWSDFVDPNAANNTARVLTTVYPQPRLTISRPAAKLVKVSWSDMLSNYTLQAISPLSVNPADWTNITDNITTEAGTRSITEPAVAPSKLYRLKK